MSRKQKKTLIRIIVSAVLLAAALLLPYPQQWYWRLAAFLVPYGVIGYGVIWRAVRNIAHGQIFDENFLMVIATIGALAIGEYPEAVLVMIFNQVGELFESYAVGKSRRSISEMMNIRPDYANIRQNGELVQVSPEQVKVGDIFVVKAGERIPLDGVITSGSSALDTAALTGESLPREVTEGDQVLSGCVNTTGLLEIKATKEFACSTVSKILDLVENSSAKKARTESFITKFARYYTPCVVIGAVLLTVIPSLITGNWLEWLKRALTFLVISCPCALVISVPLSFFGGIGGAAKNGILVKGGNYLEALAKAETVAFDKTGTLTEGVFDVAEIHSKECTEQELLELAALAESYSDHPVSRSLKEAYGKKPDTSRVGAVKELAGRGVQVEIDGRQAAVGNDKLMREMGIAFTPCAKTGTVVYTAVDGIYAGYILISDKIKSDSRDAIQKLKKAGVKRTVMLTGDTKEAGEAVADELGLDEVYTRLLPADKVERVEQLLDQKTGGTLVFVGDGINDAPVLSRADVGIAMGGIGSDAAIEAADIVLMDDKPTKIARAIAAAKKTVRIARQNIVFALAVKALVLVLGALGVSGMWEAVFADVGVSVIAILNSMRAMQVRGA